MHKNGLKLLVRCLNLGCQHFHAQNRSNHTVVRGWRKCVNNFWVFPFSIKKKYWFGPKTAVFKAKRAQVFKTNNFDLKNFMIVSKSQSLYRNQIKWYIYCFNSPTVNKKMQLSKDLSWKVFSQAKFKTKKLIIQLLKCLIACQW